MKKGCYKKRQLYRCKNCLKYQRFTYVKKKVTSEKLVLLKKLVKEGVGTSSISRLLEVSKSSVQRKLLYLSNQTIKPLFNERQQDYEMDELRTYTGHKKNECWIIYALNKATKQVMDFVVGRRTTENIKRVLNSILSLRPKRIFTDKLNVYPALLSGIKHIASPYKINHIERKKLNAGKDWHKGSAKRVFLKNSRRNL